MESFGYPAELCANTDERPNYEYESESELPEVSEFRRVGNVGGTVTQLAASGSHNVRADGHGSGALLGRRLGCGNTNDIGAGETPAWTGNVPVF